MPPFAAAVFLLLPAALAAQTIRFVDDLYPGGSTRYADDELARRLVDDLTGEPVVGAEVFVLAESETPIAGRFWFLRRAVSDADGFVRISPEPGEKWHLQVVRSERHGTASQPGAGDWIWRLGRAFDVPVLVRDWRGEPVGGALVGFCGGCGHTPDLANATTGPDGVGILRGIDPWNDIRDVYVQHPGTGLGYESIRWHPGDPPSIVDTRWSVPMTGRVVDHTGAPVAAAFVAALDVHRGPWAETAKDGTFTMLGGDPAIGASHVRLADGREVWFATPKRYPVTLRLPDPDGDDPHEGTIDVEEFDHEAVPATRRVALRLEGAPGLQVSVDYPGAPEQRSKGTHEVEVPVQGPFVFWLWTERDHGQPWARAFAFGGIGELPEEPVELRYWAPTRVRGRAVDATGQPAAVRVRVRAAWAGDDDEPFQECADGTFDVPAWASGLSLLEVAPLRADLCRRLVWVRLPLRGDDQRVDLPAVHLSEAPQVHVFGADGQPLRSATVGFQRAGLQEPGQVRRYPLDERGGWSGPDLAVGDTLVVVAEPDAVPFRHVVTAAEPLRLVVPHGVVRLAVRDEHGAGLAATVIVRDHEDETDDSGRLELRGLPDGETTLWVSAPGRRTAVVTTTARSREAAGEPIVVVLPPR
jgi:hypothetical protein